MKEYKKEIMNLENIKLEEDIHVETGQIPILISAPHSLKLINKDIPKLNEPFTKAIALYLHNNKKSHAFINNLDIGIDPNKKTKTYYSNSLVQYIKKNNIKLVIDPHGAKEDRKFDIDLGTLNNLTAGKTTVNYLVECFNNNGVEKVFHNDTFKGGGITRNIYTETNADVIQIEINADYRMNVKNLKKIIDSLDEFISKYSEIHNK